MPKRICWKKGMRLTDDILRASDEAHLELVSHALMLATAGRFGLFPVHRPFNLSLNISKGFIEVESLSCLAITKDGGIIDVHYESKYDIYLENRIQMPSDTTIDELYLTINAKDGSWKEGNDGYEEPAYEFGWITPNSTLPGYAIPIAHLVNNEYAGWHVDDIDFVPPCLFITSHHKFQDLFNRFQEILSNMNMKIQDLLHSGASKAMSTYWPFLQQIMITIDKERDVMTPMQLLGNVQQFIGTFAIACKLDEDVDLTDSDQYFHFAQTSYNYQNVYQRIKEGVETCFKIYEKVDHIKMEAPKAEPVKIDAPYIQKDQLFQNCKKSTIKIPIINPTAEAIVYYSTDGSEPSIKLKEGTPISINNNFTTKKEPEPDKKLVIKLKSILNGVSSEVKTFSITLHKDYNSWIGIVIP